MPKIYHLLFKRKLDPRMFMTSVGIALILIFIVLVIVVGGKLKQWESDLVVYPPANKGRVIDPSELYVEEKRQYLTTNDPGETIFSLGQITAFALSSNWDRLATGCELGVFLWDNTGERPTILKRFINPSDVPKSLAFSPNGQWLAQGNDKGSLTLWEIERGKALIHIHAHVSKTISRIVFSPDGASLATGDAYGRVKIWAVETGELIEQFIMDSDVTSISFTPDSRYLLASSLTSNVLIVWNIKKNKKILFKQGLKNNPYSNVNVAPPSAMFSPDGKRILSHCSTREANSIVLWDVILSSYRCDILGETYLSRLSSNQPQAAEYQNATFTPDGLRILTAGDCAVLWDAKSGELIRTFQEENGSISYVACSPDGEQFLTVHSNSNFFAFRELETGRVIRSFQYHSAPTPYTYFMPDSKRILSGSYFGDTLIWDVESHQRIRTPLLQTEEMQWPIAYSLDRKKILTQSYAEHYNNGISVCSIWDVKTGEKIQTIEEYFSPFISVIFSKDGSKLITGDENGLITVWDIATGEITAQMQKNYHLSIHSFSLFPHENWIAVNSTESDTVYLCDIQTGRFLRSWHYPDGLYLPILFTRDEKTAVSNTRELDYLMTDIVSGATRVIPSGNSSKLRLQDSLVSTSFYNHLAAAPDRPYFVDVTEGIDGQVKIVDLETMKMIKQFPHKVMKVTSIDISPDGKWLLINGADGSIRIWDLSEPFE